MWRRWRKIQYLLDSDNSCIWSAMSHFYSQIMYVLHINTENWIPCSTHGYHEESILSCSVRKSIKSLILQLCERSKMKRLHFRSLGKMDMFTLFNCQFHSRNILKSDFLSDFQTLCVWSLLQSAQTPKSCCAPPLAVFREKKCQKYCNILIEDTVLLHCTKIFFSLRRAAYTAVVSYYILVLQLYHFFVLHR